MDTVVERIINSISRAGKQQPLDVGVFGNDSNVCQWMLGQASYNRFPCLAEVGGLVNVRIAVVD